MRERMRTIDSPVGFSHIQNAGSVRASEKESSGKKSVCFSLNIVVIVKSLPFNFSQVRGAPGVDVVLFGGARVIVSH